jgi:hypothetical protein
VEFKFPIIELVDRYAIAQVKYMRTNGANEAEFEFYKKEVDKLDTLAIYDELIALKILHHKIWDLEDDFKKCRIDGTDLAEVGRRALEIRDYNNTRVTIKNKIAEILNDPVREIKV